MDLDKWDWAMIIGMTLLVLAFILLICLVPGDGGSSGSDCFFTYSGTVATAVCT